MTRENNLHGNAGINWQIADSHFLGGKVEWGRTLSRNNYTETHDELFENGLLVDKLSTRADDWLGEKAPMSLGANVYYNGLVGNKLGIDINLDYYGSDNSTVSLAKETSAMTHDAEVHSNSNNDGRLYAAKAVLSYPVGPGRFRSARKRPSPAATTCTASPAWIFRPRRPVSAKTTTPGSPPTPSSFPSWVSSVPASATSTSAIPMRTRSRRKTTCSATMELVPLRLLCNGIRPGDGHA